MSSYHGIKGMAGPAMHERLSDEYKQDGKRIRTQASGIGQGHFQPASGRSEASKRKISGQEYGAARISAGDSGRQDRSPLAQTYGRGYGADGSQQDKDNHTQPTAHLNGYSQAPPSKPFQFRFEPPSQHPKPQQEQPRQQQRIFSQGTNGTEGRARLAGESKLDIVRDWQGYRAHDRLSPAERPITNGSRDYPTQQGRTLERAGSAFSTGWPTSRDRIPNGSAEQEEEKPMVNSNGEPVTLRDLIDNPDLRVEAFRRSLSSQKSDQQNNSLNGEPQEHGRAPSSTAYHSSNRLLQARERPMMNEIPRGTRVSSTTTTHAPNHKATHKNNPATDMDIDVLPSGPQRTNAPTLPSFSFQPSTRGGANHTNIKSKSGDYRAMMPTERQRTDLYHSSYSPSEFSRDDDEEEDDEGEHDQDTVELTKPISSTGRATAPNGTQSHQAQGQPLIRLQEKGAGDTQVQSQLRPQPKLPHQPQSQSHLHPHPQSDNPSDSRDESFEARVAECRARRKGEAAGEMPTTANIAGSTVVPEVVLPRNPSPRPTAPVNRLDRGTSLAVEDLASPTHFNFGTQQSRHHQEQRLTQHPAEGSRQAGPSTLHEQQSTVDFPTLSTADLPVQQNNLTEHEKLFIELSEGLGEGQTVKLVFGTHKAMIRQLKRENRKLAKKCQQLEKKHEKQKKQLERSKKANERLAQSKDVAAHHDAADTPSSSQQTAAEAKAEQEQASHRIAMQQRELDEINRQRNVWKRLIAEAKKQAEDSDPLHMLDSDSDDDDDDGADEDTTSESESDEDGLGSSAEDPSRVLYRSNGSEGRKPQLSPAKRDSAMKQPSSKASLGTSSKPRGGQKSKAIEDQAQYSHSPSRGRSKSSRETITHSKTISPDVHRIVEKLGEIHIHNHHHHYGSDIKSGTPSPASLSRLAFEDPRALNRDDAGLEISSDMQRLSIGSGLKSAQRGPADQDFLTVPTSSSSRGVLNRSSPLSADRPATSPLAEPQNHHPTSQPHTQSTDHRPRNTNETEADQNHESQDYQPFRIRVSGSSSGRSRGHVKFEGSPVQEPTVSAINPSLRHRKFSIDLHRIKAMCKNHDPKRCVVCRSSRDNGGPDKHRPSPSVEGHSPRSVTSTHDRLSTTRFKLSEVATAEPESPAIRTPREAKLPVVTSTDTGGTGSGHSSVRGHEGNSSERRPADHRGSRSMNHKRPPEMLSSEKKKARRLEEDNHDLTPEQQLHRVIVELTQDIQKVRRSYNELSRDQDALVAEMDGSAGGSVGGGSSNSRKGKGKKIEDDHGASTDKTDRREGVPGSIAKQRQQLQASADNLAEKMKNAIRLREHYLQERQRQDQGTGIRKSGSSSTSRTGLGLKEPRFEERSVEADRDTRHASLSDSDGHRIGKNVEEDSGTQRKRGMSISKRIEDQNQNARDVQDNAQRATRSTNRRKDQRSSPREEEGEVGTGKEESHNDRNEDPPEAEVRDVEGDREPHTKRFKGIPVARSRLKEPEGYRHRLTSGIRVPKLHNDPHP